MRGTGEADVFVMPAHPVGHAKRPRVFNEIFERKGLDDLMVPPSCRPEEFEAFWAGITAAENVRGVIVSAPHKTAVHHKCPAVHDRAARVRGANSVRRRADGRRHADGFDGMGFGDAHEAAGHGIAGRRVVRVGAGGAGASPAYRLAGLSSGGSRRGEKPPGRHRSGASRCLGLAGGRGIPAPRRRGGRRRPFGRAHGRRRDTGGGARGRPAAAGCFLEYLRPITVPRFRLGHVVVPDLKEAHHARIHAERAAIVDAIERRDGRTARRVMRGHLANGLERVRALASASRVGTTGTDEERAAASLFAALTWPVPADT